jgi:hypothetical protein
MFCNAADSKAIAITVKLLFPQAYTLTPMCIWNVYLDCFNYREGTNTILKTCYGMHQNRNYVQFNFNGHTPG